MCRRQVPEALDEALEALTRDHVAKQAEDRDAQGLGRWRSRAINGATELTLGGSADLTHSNLTITKGDELASTPGRLLPAATCTTASASTPWPRR